MSSGGVAARRAAAWSAGCSGRGGGVGVVSLMVILSPRGNRQASEPLMTRRGITAELSDFAPRSSLACDSAGLVSRGVVTRAQRFRKGTRWTTTTTGRGWRSSDSLFFILTIFALATYVLGSWFLMKIFDKAGVQGRWRAWVPVYNLTIFSKLGDLSPWLVLYGIGLTFVLGFIGLGWLGSIAVFVVTLLAAWRVGLKLQKEAAWLILYFFLPLVWLGILGFDRSRWNPAIPPAPWAGNGFLRDGTTWAGIPAQAGSYPAGPQGYGAPGAYPPPAPGAPPVGYAAAPAAYAAPGLHASARGLRRAAGRLQPPACPA